MNWEKVRLGEVCEVIAGQSPPSSTYNDDEKGLPFFQGKADFGIHFPKVRMWCNAPNKIALPNDVLLSVRAPVGPTNLCNTQSCIGRGLAAVRSGKLIDSKYVYYYFKEIEPQLSQQGTGSTFSAITTSVVRDLEIPLPPLPEQQKIAAVLDAADAVRQKDKALLAQYDALLQSTFHHLFGDPVRNEKGWEVRKFGEVGKLDRGISKHRPRNAPELLGGKYPLVQTGDVANSEGYISGYKSTYSDVGLKQSKLWPKGTLCITIAANIAKTGVLEIEACFPDSVVGFIPNNHTNTSYVQTWLSKLQKILEDAAPESAQKNINLDILRNLQIPVPPLALQAHFSGIAQNIQRQKALVKEQAAQSEVLFQSLLHRSFNPS